MDDGGTHRVSPTVLAAVALGVLILMIVGMMLWGSRSGENDRLTGAETTESSGDLTARCSSKSASEGIKNALFQQAAELRGGDQSALTKVAASASIRMEAVELRDEGSDGSITCNGTVTLDLPPGVAASGKRSLSADVLYTIQGDALTLADASAIVIPLSSIAGTETESSDALSNSVTNDIGTLPVGTEPADPLAPQPGTDNSAGGPSFSCSSDRTAGEVAVCNDPALSALDRRMSAQFSGALAQASPEQRALLIRTRNEFLGYRDQCTENACIADTYRGRMREIRDIMSGNWHPQR